MKKFLFFVEDIGWNIRCRYNFYLHGPYGLAKVIGKMPFRFIIKYLKEYGATIGNDCRFERGLNLHRPFGKKTPFENLIIGNKVYLGHNTLIDLSMPITIEDEVIFASRCQIWTHASYYILDKNEKNTYGENYGPVKVKKGALVYSGCIITHNITLGKFSIIGASSLVNRSVGDYEFWGGVPAKFINKRKRY
jgi:acetyltransferase-like isoleucine patch superfamily enzyme